MSSHAVVATGYDPLFDNEPELARTPWASVTPRIAGRLVAVAIHDTILVPLWREQAQQEKITALVYGHSTEAGPSVVA